MKRMSVGILVVVVGVALFGVLLVAAISIYNRLVRLRNRYENAYSQIDVQLKRRHDLIPNLVTAAKAYLTHERETLEAVVQARGNAVGAAERARQSPGSAPAMQALAQSESVLSGALSRLLVVAEAYPELKAQGTVSELSEDLRSTENKISFARQAYNDAVTEYDNGREAFPAVIFAGMFGFAPAALLQSIQSDEERKAPQIAL
jgi:LemA protein